MIREATTDADILGTFPVMRQLRPRLEEEGYLEVARRLQSSGYRLAFAAEGEKVRCVAGFTYSLGAKRPRPCKGDGPLR